MSAGRLDQFATRLLKKLTDSHLFDSLEQYELSVMSKNELKQRGVIEFDCCKEGLKYQVIGLDERLKSDMISWEDLPNDFPRQNAVIVEKKRKILPEIIKVTAQRGDTSLAILPPIDERKLAKNNNPCTVSIDINSHPLVLLESQATLFQIKNTLEFLSNSRGPLNDQALAPLQEILNRRFKHRLSATCSASFFYGTESIFKANEACIELAKALDAYLSSPSEIYVHRLIPGLTQRLEDTFNFKNYQLSFVKKTAPVGPMPIYDEQPIDQYTPCFEKSDVAVKRTLSVADEELLYDILYSGMGDIPGLIVQLKNFVPPNTWDLYLSCLATKDLLTLALEKPAEMTEQEFSSIQTTVQTLMNEPRKNSDLLWKIFDTVAKQLFTPPKSSEDNPTALKKDNDDWNRTIFFAIISLYDRIRAMLPETYSRITTPTQTKSKKLQETGAILEFLTLINRPLATIDLWLQKNQPTVEYNLSSGLFTSFAGMFVNLNGRLDDIYSKIKINADRSPKALKDTETVQEKPTTGLLGMRWGW